MAGESLPLTVDQEANFSYLTGCNTPNASLFVTFSVGPSSTPVKAHHQLFVPRADPLETMWSVAPPTLEESEEMFDSDKIAYLEEVDETIKRVVKEADKTGKEIIIHTLPLTLEFPALPEILSSLESKSVKRDTELLLDAVQIARLTKDEYEIDLIREANRISSGAHEVLMRELGRFADKRRGEAGKRKRSGKEGLTMWEVESEGDAEALFVATCRRAGLATLWASVDGSAGQAYLPICASGSRASTLHYV